MTRDWKVLCKDCRIREVPYSDRSAKDALMRGQSPPERCLECRAKHNRAISRMGAAYLDVEMGRVVPANGVKAGRLGKISRPDRPHSSVDKAAEPLEPDTFGIQDEHVRELIEGLENHRVAIVQAGTGSGKSTFLPWRLLCPPSPFAEDHLTRYGRIVVTQPRIEATTGIPEFVATRLHGSRPGAGLDIGYRNSKATDRTDQRNKLVYLTDGTLVNMIRKSELHDVSVIVIDEAHERSLNIDLILALLRRELRAMTHLRLLIVSATLDAEAFSEFFAPDYKVLNCSMPSKGLHAVHERWRAGEPIPFKSWSRRMPAEAADCALEVLRWMGLGEHPADIPATVPNHDGDILCFLPGKRAIHAAIAAVEEGLEGDPELNKFANKVELLPLYAELPEAERRRALVRSRKKKGTRWRVIFSTNLAETSLTVEGVRHVIDSGLINRTEWDPATASSDIRPAPHSRSGLLQRRGRAGRTAPGVWHCLFTKAQFESLEFATPPEIVRAPLAAVLLVAAAAGVGDPAALRWMPPGPPFDEMTRATSLLRGIGAVSPHGDPTSLGQELVTAREDFDVASLLIGADQAGCALEAATVVAAVKSGGSSAMLSWNRAWPAAAKVHVHNVHSAMLSGCADDVEVVCRIWAEWEVLPDEEAQKNWAARHYVDDGALRMIATERLKLIGPLQARTKTGAVRALDMRLLSRLRAVAFWASPNAVYSCSPAAYNGVGSGGGLHLEPMTTPRSDAAVLTSMHAAAKPVVDDRSWCSMHPPSHLVMLDRQRIRRWTSPLVDPEVVLHASFCAAIDPSLLHDPGSFLGVLGSLTLDEVDTPLRFLPGDRFMARMSPGQSNTYRLTLGSRLSPLPDPTIDIVADDDGDSGDEDREGGDLAQDRVLNNADTLEPVLDSEVSVPEDQIGEDEAGDAILPEARPNEDRAPTFDPQTAALRLIGARLDVEDGLATDAGPGDTLAVSVEGVDADGVLRCTLDRTAAFEAFVARFSPGAVFDVTVQSVRIFPRERRPLIVARELTTGLELPLDGDAIGTGLRYVLLRQMQQGQSIPVVIDAIDKERGRVDLSQTPMTLSALHRLMGDRSRKVVLADVIDASEEALFLQVVPGESGLLANDPPILLEAAGKDLPSRPMELRLGHRVRVQLTWGRNYTPRYYCGDLGEFKLPLGPYQLQGERLVASEPVAAGDWARLMRMTEKLDAEAAAQLRRAATKTAARSLLPRVAIIDVTGIAEMAEQGTGLATVASIAPDGAVTVLLPTGDRRRIRSTETQWPGDDRAFAVGDDLTVFVKAADPDAGIIEVSLRDPDLNPFRDLIIGDVYDGTVERVASSGRSYIVRLSNGATGRLPASESTSHSTDEDGRSVPDLDVDSSVEVRVVSVDPESMSMQLSCWLIDVEIELPARLTPLWSTDGRNVDVSAWRNIVGDGVRVDLVGAPPAGVRLRAMSEPAGYCADALFRTAMRGVLGIVEVPYPGPLTADHAAAKIEIATRTGSLLALRRLPDQSGPGSKPHWALWIAAESRMSYQRVVNEVASLYPEVWLSDPFKCKTESWNQARTALEDSGVEVKIARRPISSATGPPSWIATISCDPYDLNFVLSTFLCAGCPVASGQWQTDPRLMAGIAT